MREQQSVRPARETGGLCGPCRNRERLPQRLADLIPSRSQNSGTVKPLCPWRSTISRQTLSLRRCRLIFSIAQLQCGESGADCSLPRARDEERHGLNAYGRRAMRARECDVSFDDRETACRRGPSNGRCNRAKARRARRTGPRRNGSSLRYNSAHMKFVRPNFVLQSYCQHAEST
jgi:hypothetical protein